MPLTGAQRQARWVARRRLRLMQKITGLLFPICWECWTMGEPVDLGYGRDGLTLPIGDLEIDHANGDRDWEGQKGPSTRMSLHERDYRDGVKLRVLCKRCHGGETRRRECK